MKKLIVIGFAVSTLSSCAWVFSTPSGIKALSEHNVGLATVDKEDSPFHELRRLEAEQKTLRIRLRSEEE